MTQSGTNCEQRNIVLIPFPFSDFSTTKKRPVLILSNKEYNNSNRDILCCAITSKPRDYKYSVEIKNTDLEDGNLIYDSKVRPNRIFTLEQTKIIKKLAKLNTDKYNQVISNINRMIQLDEEESHAISME